MIADETTISDILDRIRKLASEASGSDGLPPKVREALAAIIALTQDRRDVGGETSDPPSTEGQSL